MTKPKRTFGGQPTPCPSPRGRKDGIRKAFAIPPPSQAGVGGGFRQQPVTTKPGMHRHPNQRIVPSVMKELQ